jgi:hypothetical protein
MGCAPEIQVRRRLAAGGRWIRTLGPARTRCAPALKNHGTPSRRISRTALSDKTSRVHPRRAAAMSESGKYGPTRCIAGIIGFIDLQLGSRAKGVLERHIAVSDGRLRAIRNGSTWSDDPTLKTFTAGSPKGLLLDNNFREGFAALAPLGLAFDGWMFQTQLDDLVDLARAFPQTQCGHHGLAGASST